MNAAADAYLLGWLVVAVGVFQLVPAAVAARAGEPVEPWLWSAVTALALGLSTVLSASSSRPGRGRGPWRLQARDGFLLAGVGWPLAALFGALPLALAEVLPPLDAFLEAVAGFTTTGATALRDVDGAPRSVLAWRAITQWLGGAGVLVFGVAVLPLLPTGGMQVFRTELPAGARRLAPRVQTTVRTLGALYVVATALAALAFAGLGGMSIFDSVCHAFSSISTGGHSTRTASLGAFPTGARVVAMAAMAVGGTSFVLLVRVIAARSPRPFWEDGEFRAFAAVALAGVGLLVLAGGSWGAAAFHGISAVTSTGFHAGGIPAGSGLAQLVLLQLMLAGAMAGSTCGGLKSLRLLLGWRALHGAVARLLHPHAVRSVKYAGRPLSEEAVGGVWAFFTCYALVVVGVAALLAAGGYDARAALSASVAAVGNAGLALGGADAADVRSLGAGAKWVLCAAMIAGRLEVMTALVLLSPGLWRR